MLICVDPDLGTYKDGLYTAQRTLADNLSIWKGATTLCVVSDLARALKYINEHKERK